MNTQYYSKYIKYKQKYIKLRQKQKGGVLSIDLIYCGFGGCAFKLYIDNKQYVLKCEYSDTTEKKDTTNKIRHKIFENELLKGIEVFKLCNKINIDMLKHFCTPIYIPLTLNTDTDNMKENIITFYKKIYNEHIKYYNELNNTTYTSIMNDPEINENNLLDELEPLINSNIELIKLYKKDIIENITKWINGSHNKAVQQISIENSLWYITEYGGKDLFHYMKDLDNNIIDNIDEIDKILKQIHEVMNFLHSNKIYHLDFRLNNICYDDKHIKVIDFGMSCNMKEIEYINSSKEPFGKNKILIATDCMPPEILVEYILSGTRIPFSEFSFDQFYMAKLISKLFTMDKDLNYKYRTSINKYIISDDNKKSYFEKNGFKWADYIGISLSFLNFFIRCAIQKIKITDENKENKEKFNKIYSMLLSWCIVNYKKRLDKFYTDDVSYNFYLRYNYIEQIKFESFNKFVTACNPKYTTDTHCDLYRYFEQLYSQLDPD